MRVRCQFILFLLLVQATLCSAAKERISILDFMVSPDAKRLVNVDASKDLTQQVRDAATRLLDSARFEIMTRENILVMLPPGKNLSECEGQCEVEMARNLGARWHVVGDVGRVGRKLVLSVRLYDVASGTQLGGVRIEGKDVDELVDNVGPRAVELLGKIPATGMPQHRSPPKADAIEKAPERRTASWAFGADASYDVLSLDYQGESYGNGFRLGPCFLYNAPIDATKAWEGRAGVWYELIPGITVAGGDISAAYRYRAIEPEAVLEFYAGSADGFRIGAGARYYLTESVSASLHVFGNVGSGSGSGSEVSSFTSVLLGVGFLI